MINATACRISTRYGPQASPPPLRSDCGQQPGDPPLQKNGAPFRAPQFTL